MSVNDAATRLRPIEVEFLEGFVSPAAPRSLDAMGNDDRLFITGVRDLRRACHLELPQLPPAARRLRELLGRGDISIPRYVDLVEHDPAVAVEVLKVANNAQLGANKPITSVADAVLRIGLQRLESILLLAHVKSTLLRGGPLQLLSELLLDMSIPLGLAAARLADDEQDNPNLAFIRATLQHVQHLVVLSALTDVTREHTGMLVPSVAAIHQAFDEHCPEIRVAVAKAWDLERLLIGGDESAALNDRFTALRNALACEWLDMPLPAVGNVEPEHLRAVLGQVARHAA